MTKLALAARPLACVSLAVLISCGGATSTTGSASPVAEFDFSASYKQIMCDLLSKCCNSGFDGVTACSALSAPTAPSQYKKYDPDQAGACIATLRSFASTCTATKREYDAACSTIYVGNQAIGTPCQSTEDCTGNAAGKTYCSGGGLPPGNESCQPTAKLGELCAGGLYASPALGGSPCGGGLYCGPSSLCTPLAGFGQPCDPLYLSLSCDAALRCDPASMKCTNKVPTGATCTGGIDCVDGDCSNGICQGPTTIATSGLCSNGGESLFPTPSPDAGM